jgi:hypothetical protein
MKLRPKRAPQVFQDRVAMASPEIDDATRLFIVQQVPLAQLILGLFQHLFQADFLDDLFQRHRGRSYEKVLDFATMVQVLGDAIMKHGTVYPALVQARRQQQVTVSEKAFYAKLNRIPLTLSLGLLDEGRQRLQELLPTGLPHAVPDCFAGLQVLLVDGKKSKNVAKRLLATRGQPGKVFGAKFLVCLEARTRLVVAAAAAADGECNDNPLVPELLHRLRPQRTLPPLFVHDAQFCDLVQVQRVVGEQAFFVFRHHPKTHFRPDPERPAHTFVDAQGRTLVEEFGWLGSPKDPRRCAVRRVTWLRASATHKDLSVVTNLTDNTAYPASALIDLYLLRWKIETVFQEVATVFGLKHLIGSTPEASAFETVLCMLVYNMIQVIKARLAAQQNLTVDDVSSANLFRDIRGEMTALYKMLPPARIVQTIPLQQTAEQMQRWLEDHLQGHWDTLWKKARNKNPRRYTAKPKKSGAHTSIERLRQAHKKNPKRAP